jgi:para-aminobenzoate synthetase/4-amino-4-deoxychorismate lyase
MRHIQSSTELAHILQTNDHVVLLENTLGGQSGGWNDLFINPLHILQIHHVSEFLPLLESMQKYVQEGYFLAGYFTYECGYFLEKLALLDYKEERYPLAWFGVYRQRYRIDTSLFKDNIDDFLAIGNGRGQAPAQHASRLAFEEIGRNVRELRFDLDEETYRQKVERVQEHIRAGDVYQINLTGRYHFRFDGTPLALYARLRQVQRTAYSAYIRTGDCSILCFSPELFFRLDGQHITARPMKGTTPRGRTLIEDERQATWLQSDGKNRAENIMIVDLLRNDLGRICTVGSITVPHLLRVETYDTLLQMTSTVTGRLVNKTNYPQIFASLFPCGSVTGAPKIKAMEIINQLETTPRGIYTGSIGYIAPQTANTSSHALFNVAIRTIELEQGYGIMGIGSGIVHDSSATEEAAECKIKAHFLTTQPKTFDILETILWDHDYRHLEKHLQRMAASARYFGYPWDEERIRAHLTAIALELTPTRRDSSYKVRLRLNRQGGLHCESLMLQKTTSNEQLMIALSGERTDSRDRMYFHKTTYRPLYERAQRFARQHGYADIIFLNEKGEVTEGAISNVFTERGGKLLTPPVECGLLAGIYRQCILEEYPNAQEAVLSLDDLLSAERIYVCNAIRGLRQVRVVRTPLFR